VDRWLVIMSPQDSAGVVQSHRFSSGLAQPWRLDAHERILTLPTLSLELLVDGFGRAGSSAGVGALSLANQDGALNALLGLAWVDALVEVYRADVEIPTDLSDCTLFAKLRAESIAQDERGRITVALRDLSGALDVPLKLPRYAGTGGAEGSAEFANRVKPFALGPQFNVPLEGKFIDRAALIAQVHCRRIGGILFDAADPRRQGVTDKGVPLQAAGDYATFTALKAADLSAPAFDGTYVTCVAEGLIRLARTPKGVVCVDFEGDADVTDGGYVETPGEVIQRILDALWDGGGLTVDAAALAQLDADVPHPVKLYVDSDGVRVSDWIETVAVSVGAAWWVDELGELSARIFEFSTPSQTLYDWQVSAPVLVDAWPRWNPLVLGWGAPTRVMSEEELAESVTSTSQLADDANLGGTAQWAGVSGTGRPEDNANRTTNTNQLSDGANLGGTAQWSGVSGAGRPEDNANRTTDTNQLADGANLGGTAQWSGVSGAGRPEDNATRGVIDSDSAETDGEVSNSSNISWTTAQSHTFTLTETTRVVIEMSGNIYRLFSASTTFSQVRARKNGVEVGGLSSLNTFVPGTAYQPWVYRREETLGPGTYTYDFQFRQVAGGITTAFRNRVINHTELL
jgi:hypothetical protein